jgi:hypothetical protein
LIEPRFVFFIANRALPLEVENAVWLPNIGAAPVNFFDFPWSPPILLYNLYNRANSHWRVSFRLRQDLMSDVNRSMGVA